MLEVNITGDVVEIAYSNELTIKECEAIISKYDKNKIAKIFEQLDEDEKNIFTLYYGIDCAKLMKKEIALKLNFDSQKLKQLLFNIIELSKELYPEDFSSHTNVFYSKFFISFAVLNLGF